MKVRTIFFSIAFLLVSLKAAAGEGVLEDIKKRFESPEYTWKYGGKPILLPDPYNVCILTVLGKKDSEKDFGQYIFSCEPNADHTCPNKEVCITRFIKMAADGKVGMAYAEYATEDRGPDFGASCQYAGEPNTPRGIAFMVNGDRKDMFCTSEVVGCKTKPDNSRILCPLTEADIKQTRNSDGKMVKKAVCPGPRDCLAKSLKTEEVDIKISQSIPGFRLHSGEAVVSSNPSKNQGASTLQRLSPNFGKVSH